MARLAIDAVTRFTAKRRAHTVRPYEDILTPNYFPPIQGNTASPPWFRSPVRRRHGICVAKMLDNVGLRYPHRASRAKAPRTLRPLPLLRFAVFATGGAHLCSIQYYLRFWLSICRTSLAVSALRIIMRYCPNYFPVDPNPPAPRSVSFRVAAGTKAACHTGAMHSWATRSPGAMV